MLEILLLYFICGKIGEVARRKGRGAFGYQFVTVVLWFGGEIAGAIAGLIVDTVMHGEQAEGLGLFVYLFALGGAVAGAIVAYVFVSLMPSLRRRRERLGPLSIPKQSLND